MTLKAKSGCVHTPLPGAKQVEVRDLAINVTGNEECLSTESRKSGNEDSWTLPQAQADLYLGD